MYYVPDWRVYYEDVQRPSSQVRVERFVDIHEKLPGMTTERIKELDKKAAELGPQLNVKCTSFYNEETEGIVFLCEAPSRKAIEDEHRLLGIPCQTVLELQRSR